jgi:RNA polymerase sigma-B factor
LTVLAYAPFPAPSSRLPAYAKDPASSSAMNVRTRELFGRLARLSGTAPERQRIREEIVRLHLPLCHQLASRYLNRGEPLEDLVQAATLGLVKAVDRFDLSYGSEFSSYAVPTILGELKKHFRDTVWRVHVPRRCQELRLGVAAATEELTQRTGRAPTVAELAAHLGVDEEEVLDGMEAARAYHSASLDAPLSTEENASTLGDILGVEDPGMAGVENHQSLLPLIQALPERSRRILLLRFFGNQTQSQIAAQIGISQMHVSRLLARTLAQLREGLLVEE